MSVAGTIALLPNIVGQVSLREIFASMSLDATDKRILNALQRKGRMANADLSEAVNLSPSACHRRVQRLEKEGYIREYVAQGGAVLISSGRGR